MLESLPSHNLSNRPVKQRLHMIKIPQSIIIAMVAFNFTMFTLMLQMDMLYFGSTTLKVIFWALTIGLWRFAYMRRDKYFKLF